MKKYRNWMLLAVLLMAGAAVMVACGDTSLQSEKRKEEEPRTIEGQIEGSFTVTVRELIPDFCFDDTTLSCAVVTYFQDRPFIIYIGNHASEILEAGKTYTFTIKPKVIGTVEEALVGKEMTYLEAEINYGRMEFEDIREAAEDELGLGSGYITISAAP